MSDLGVPNPPDLTARYSRSREGRDWLEALPGLIGGCLERWGLDPDLGRGELPWNGHGAVVLPVRRADGSPAVLKVAFPHGEALVERHALALWGGSGAVTLLADDPASCAMLLERLDAGSLLVVPLDAAAEVWGAVVRELGITPDGRPQWREFVHVAARAEQWSDELPADWEQLGRPFPRWLLEAALEVCQTRGSVGRRSGRDVLVHTDLHFQNILARPLALPPTVTATGGWAAIDPQPMVGEAEFAVAPVLWNRLSDLPADQPEAALRRRCDQFSAAAGLDGEAARQWGIVREVANALWYAGKPHHQGDLARSLWVASTLAGRTLPELPAPHSLPEPGQENGRGPEAGHGTPGG